ncbi:MULTISPECIES: hypothetical protein [Streptococcus]|uniref:hypothetical protein n=1 Tax=Streptococcus TaxID=1301 RepID=UPI001EFA24AB|nr:MULTISPECIES: hypothetical protein [Streptococcus]MCB8556689.1 hypothetical protein [Streptococcus vestibularis]MCY7009508.1 hypothetical protein [Streptococcus vestibularis]MDU1715568.1 hypothetical protein [Streptococcus vestibularis]MDU1830982.1 hypothetical protein [Streptococcus vestibularis]MDU4481733.1 hypothetical protein [Streptococcus vestibularis]
MPGYRFVETKKLLNYDIEHVYEQVTISYVDENGNTQRIYKQTVTPTPELHPTLQPEEAKAPVLPETKEEAYFINPTDSSTSRNW